MGLEKKLQTVHEMQNAQNNVRAFPCSIINQFQLHDFLCLCLAHIHLADPEHLIFRFQFLGNAVPLHKLRQDRVNTVSGGFFNLKAMLKELFG